MDAQDIDYYKAAVGKNWDSHYCVAFKRISTGSIVSWNWAGCFAFTAWAIHRKMYLIGVLSAFLIAPLKIIVESFERSGNGDIAAAVCVVAYIIMGCFADFLYYKKVEYCVKKTKYIEPDTDRVKIILAATLGINKWLPKIFVGIFVLGVVLAVVIPAIADYQKREAKVNSIPLDKVDWSQFGKPIPPQDSIGKSENKVSKDNPFLDPNLGKDIQSKENIKAQQDEHSRKILAAHPDAGQVAASKEFQHWSNSNPQYKQIADAGSAEQVIWLLSTYKQKLTDESRERDRKTQEAQLQNTARKAENAQEQLNAYVRRVYPDFSEIVASQTFSNWLYYNPHNQRTAQEVVDMIRDYKRDMAQQAANQ